jgi:predicted phage terminase large subunit-like protein
MQKEQWLIDAEHKLKIMPQKAKDVRERSLADLYYFAKLVNPGYVYGGVHKEIYYWMQEYNLFNDDESLTSNKLVMLPRGHLKSHMVAVWCAWMIARHPEITVLYLSATSELAQTQLYAIQNILSSTTFMRYFPEYINPQEGKREKWSAFKLSVDHLKRKKEAIRDATIATAGLTTNTTGWHADVIIADDLVVPENAYTEEGRESVSKKASQLTSIRNAGGFTMACGTRYHPRDIYYTWSNQLYDIFDNDGIKCDEKPVWEKFEAKVEIDNIFIWPRTVREDGKAFGFDMNVLARIRAEYSDQVQFYAQYYNDPNDPESERISRDKFQYYGLRYLKKEGHKWFYKGKKLNIYAAVDFAFSLNKKADYTAIVVIGVDSDNNIYVLDIDRFKTDKTIEYFRHIASLHSKWRFRKLQAEVTAAQKVIVESIKGYVRKEGMTLSVVDFRPSKQEGSKEERIAAALEPRYDNFDVWHFEGGWTDALEDELIKSRPAHDDIKDAMASAVSISVAPARSLGNVISDFLPSKQRTSRFGGAKHTQG